MNNAMERGGVLADQGTYHRFVSLDETSEGVRVTAPENPVMHADACRALARQLYRMARRLDARSAAK